MALLTTPSAAATGHPAADPSGRSSVRPVAGSTSGGDPYFPAAGNSGYQVEHYDLDLRYDPAARTLAATARVEALATSSVRSFSLDLRDLRDLRDLAVASVRVDGVAARFTHRDGELVVTPRHWIRAGRPFAVTVAYSGTTGRPLDVTGAPYCWVSMPDGAFVANEPEGASTWYPSTTSPATRRRTT